MASKSKYIGFGTSILTISALIVWFMLSPDFQVEYSGDINCAGTLNNPCISFINVTFTPQNPTYKYFYVYNREGVRLDFSPDISQYALCKPDGRYKKERSLDNLCGPGYREILTQPYYYKYSYYYKFYKNQKEEWMLVGLKNNPIDKVKWGMNAVDTYIDPVWDSKEEDKPSTFEYTPSTEKICNGNQCSLTLYSGTRFADSTGKKIEKAESLKDCEFCEGIKLEISQDPKYPVTVLDYNYTDIQIEFKAGLSELEKDIPIKIYTKGNESDVKFQSVSNLDKDGDKDTRTLKLGFGKEIKYGEHSTTITLQDADSENLIDSFVTNQSKTTNYGTLDEMTIGSHSGFSKYPNQSNAYFKFNISELIEIENADITSSELILDGIQSRDWDGDKEIGIYQVYNWTNSSNIDSSVNETTINWVNQPCGMTFENSTNCNLTAEDVHNFEGGGKIERFNVTNITIRVYNDNLDNVSFAIRKMIISDDGILISSKEESSSFKRPLLNITYISGPSDRPPQIVQLSNVTTSDTWFNLTWNYSDGTGSIAAETQVDIFRNGSLNVTIDYPQISVNITGLTGGESYNFTGLSKNASGTNTSLNTSNQLTLDVTAIIGAIVTLPSWKDMGGNFTTSTPFHPNGSEYVQFFVNVSNATQITFAWNDSGSYVNVSNFSIDAGSINATFNFSVTPRNNESIGFQMHLNNSDGGNFTDVVNITVWNISDYIQGVPIFSNNADNSSTIEPNGTNTIGLTLEITHDIQLEGYHFMWNCTEARVWQNISNVTNLGISYVMRENHSVAYFNNETCGWRTQANASNGNIAVSDIYTFVSRNISSTGKLDSSCTLSITDASPITFPNAPTPVCTCSGDGTTTLNVNGSTLANDTETDLGTGLFNINCSIAEGSGYLSNFTNELYEININTTTCDLVLNDTSSVVFGEYINTTCTCDNSEVKVNIGTNLTNVTNNSVNLFGGGTHNINCSVPASGNFTANWTNELFTVTRAASSVTCSINGTAGDRALNVSNDINLSCLTTGDGPVDLLINSTINATDEPLVNITAQWGTNQTLNITGIHNQTQNYTINFDSIVLTLNNEVSSTLDLLLCNAMSSLTFIPLATEMIFNFTTWSFDVFNLTPINQTCDFTYNVTPSISNEIFIRINTTLDRKNVTCGNITLTTSFQPIFAITTDTQFLNCTMDFINVSVLNITNSTDFDVVVSTVG